MSVDVNMSHFFEGVAKDRNFSYLLLDNPSDLKGQFPYQSPDVKQTLMIRHDHVITAFIYLFHASDLHPRTGKEDVEQRPEPAYVMDYVSIPVERGNHDDNQA